MSKRAAGLAEPDEARHVGWQGDWRHVALRVNRNPSPRDLRWFGLLLPLFVALVGAIARWQFGAPAAALGIWSVGGALAAL